MTGETPLALWLPVVVAVLRDRFAGNPGTAEKLVAETQRLFRYLMACDARIWSDVNSALVTEWCWAARPDRSGVHRSTATSTARNRQWAALAAFEAAVSSGAPIDPRTLIGDRIARPSESESARPLTDDEHRLVLVHADAGRVASRRSMMVALSRAGGTASEVAAVRMGDIDLDAAAVEFCSAAARVGPLTRGVLRRFCASCATTRHCQPTRWCASPPAPAPIGPRTRCPCASGRCCEMPA